MKAMWFGAMTTGPVAGMFEAPMISISHRRCMSGRNTRFAIGWSHPGCGAPISEVRATSVVGGRGIRPL